jgi:hypothetical protein
MSMNLKFESNLGEFEPIQTPTQITWTLLTSDKYGPKDKTGNEALKVLYQYKEYIKWSHNGIKFKNSTELKDFLKGVTSTLKKIDKFIKDSDIKTLKVYAI